MTATEIIEANGGSTALAKRLGIKSTAVAMWKVRGIPRAWKLALGDTTPAPQAVSTVTVVVGDMEITITVKPAGVPA
jgi:hypothetical protein